MDVDALGNTSLVSVIVPIYNVEPWLRKCLDSLENQTLKQIEVIMVEDGSTDESGRIAEEFVRENWPVFKLIHHEENRGLSAARNTGIDEAKAEYLMFVDSDDWVDKDFCRIPYEAAVDNQADIVIFGVVEETRKKSKESRNLNGLVDEFTAHEKGKTAAWNKLYKRRLFNNIRYPEGRVYEEIATTHKLVHEAQRIVMLPESLYYHEKREASITHTYSKKNKRDNFVSTFEKYEDLISYGYPKDKLWSGVCGAAIGYLARTNVDAELCMKAKDVLNQTKGIPHDLSRKQKIGLMAWKLNETVFYMLSRVTGRWKKQTIEEQ